MTYSIPRPEHPRPQFERTTWKNLNGEWEFYMDLSNSGIDRDFQKAESFDGRITVPFCPESELSGIGYKDFMHAVWYGKNIEITERELEGNVLLHFGAVDFLSKVFVNGELAGTHKGGYCSFTVDITKLLHAGKNRIVVYAVDDVRPDEQPRGKQSRVFYSVGCDYTRTTGIWQTVWLEFVPKIYLKKVKINATDLAGEVYFDVTTNAYAKDLYLSINVDFDGKRVASGVCALSGTNSLHKIKIDEPRLWNPGDPNLYDVTFTLLQENAPVDTVKSYFGIRRIDIDGKKVRINGKSVFQRLILDQGFYPDGIYTAPTDAALARDIDLSMALGYNGARLHQKVFEERFYYHADRKGYLVWGEYGSWGQNITTPAAIHNFLPEWIECVERDYNHPSLIGWCPYNETWDYHGAPQYNGNIELVYTVTKAMDYTRPVIDTSGNFHTAKTDIYDVHDYTQDVEKFASYFAEQTDDVVYNTHVHRQSYGGQPYFVSEYGGIKWSGGAVDNDKRKAWGYGDAPKTVEEFRDRFCGMARALLNTKNMMGFCYTQLTDVEQEQNGLYFYDRSPKFSPEIYEDIRRANLQTAEIEKDDF